MHPVGKSLIQILFSRFFDSRSGMVYSYAVPYRDSALPAPQEVAAGIPSEPGWGSGIEDCAMNGGILLAALTDAGEPYAAKQIFAGLRALGTASPERGFIPRGLLPDRKAYYVNSSVDQHTMFVYGLWRYSRSTLPGQDELQTIQELVSAVALRLEKNGFRILTEDGRVAIGGDSLDVIAPGKAPRLLSLLLAAHSVTGDAHWRDVYEEKASEKNAARLRNFCGLPDAGLPPGWGFYGPEQMQAQLRILAESDWDASRRRLYRDAMKEVAQRMLTTGFPSQGHAPAYTQETLAILGGTAYLASPFDWNRYSPSILRREEDWGWRADFARDARRTPGSAWALRFVLDWMGRRPAFCHERNCLRFPLTAFHVALLSGDPELKARVLPECERMFAEIDFNLCRWADALVEAIALASLMKQGAMECQ